MAKNLVTVKYVGQHPEIEFEPDGLGAVNLLRGEPIDVVDDLAANLLEQPANWQLVVKTPTTPASPKPAATAEEAK